MFTQQDLRELVDYQSDTAMISLYLNTDPSLGSADGYRLRLRNMLKSIEKSPNVDRILTYFETEYDWSGKSVAIFSDDENEFFRVFPLAVPVQDLIYVGERTNVRPLTALVDSFGGYGVVLIDKQGARLFHFHLGALKEQEGFFGDEIRQSKGSGSAMTGMRGGVGVQPRVVEEIVERNMREMVDFTTHFFEQKQIRRIILCGADDNIAMFKSYLPKAWQSLIVGSFGASMTDSNLDILERAMEVGLQAEMEREKQLVEKLITQSAKKGAAVVGFTPTLEAVNQVKVKTLVVTKGVKKPGYICPDCDLISISPQGSCDRCGQAVKSVDDVISLAVNLTMNQGGDVEVIHDETELSETAQIGAFLRY